MEQCPLVDFFQESRTQGVGHLENSSEDSLGQGVESIRVPLCSPAAIITKCPSPPRPLKSYNWPPINADKRRFSELEGAAFLKNLLQQSAELKEFAVAMRFPEVACA